jgi:hypothetical protein
MGNLGRGNCAFTSPPKKESWQLRAATDLLATLHNEVQDLEKLKRVVNFRAEFYRAAFGGERRVRASRGSIGSQG